MKEHDSFIIYKSFYEPIKGLSDDQLGRLFRAIYEWQINGQPETLNHDIEIAFGFFVNQFKVDEAKYQERCSKNRDNILKRWNNVPNNSVVYNRIQPNTKLTYNDNDNDNNNDNDIREKNLTLPYHSSDFISTWKELRSQPKWKRKTKSALQKSLDALGRYDEQFAIELMNRAIAGGYQGVVFSGTDEIYRQRQKAPAVKAEGKVIKDLSDIYE